MLISRRADRLVLVTHPDHARVCGDLAQSWGAGPFAAPERSEAFAHAAAHHDDGWAELDGIPLYSEEHRRPAHFLEVDLPLTVAPYGRGVDGIHRHDPFAGALASMHWGGLYSSRWGLQDSPPVGHPAAREVVAEQQARWVAALEEAWGGEGPRSRVESAAWHGYEVLQALDLISLALCLVDLEEPSDAAAPAPAVNGTLRDIDQPAGARTIPAVPLAPGGDHVELALTVADPGVVTLDPWPFRDGSIALEIPARTMEDRPYASAAAASEAYAAAPAQPIRATLTRAGG